MNGWKNDLFGPSCMNNAPLGQKRAVDMRMQILDNSLGMSKKRS